jgi:hypothetical protein
LSEEGDVFLAGLMVLQRGEKPSFLMVGPDRGTDFANHNTMAKARLTFDSSGLPHDPGKS